MPDMSTIKKILVVGAGTMGHGIAQSFAQEGFTVELYSRTKETLERARSLIDYSLKAFVEEKMVAKKDIPTILKRINFTQSLEKAAEDREAKIDIFGKLDRLCPPETLLASNTTALNIFDFVKTSRPDKVLISHWYTPPQIIPLVDVVKGPDTSEESIYLMAELLKKIGKAPLVLKKFISGYLLSRLQIAMLGEIFYLLDSDIITPEQLDTAAKTGLALRMMVLGLVQRMDFGGLDLTVKNYENPYMRKQLTPRDYKPVKLYELVREGHFGVKTGKGFYDYGGRTEAEVCYERDIKLIKMLRAYRELESTK
jgi:3-hydroxyacyl-CoA dehydrogenase